MIILMLQKYAKCTLPIHLSIVAAQTTQPIDINAIDSHTALTEINKIENIKGFF